MKFILLLFLVVTVNVYSVTRTVCSGGCTYTTVGAAATAGNNYDTILVSSNTVETGRVTLKTGQVLRSANSRTDTIWVGDFDGVNVADYCVIENVVIMFSDLARSATLRFLLTSKDNLVGATVNNCLFGKGVGQNLTVRRGLKWGTTVRTTNSIQIRMDRCQFDTAGIDGAGGIKITRSRFNNCAPVARVQDSLYQNSIWCRNSEIQIKGDSVYFGYNYVFNLGGEAITYDEITTRPKRVILEYNVVDSNNHVPICPDGSESGIIRNNRVTRIGTNCYSAIYVHNTNNSDSVYNTPFIRNSYWLASGRNIYNFLRSGHVVSSINEELIVGGFGTTKSTNDTLRGLLSNTAVVSDSFVTFSDTILEPNLKTYKTDSLYMFTKWRYSTRLSTQRGWTRYFNYIVDTTISSTSIAVACSVSNDFWFFTPWKPDTATTVIQYSTDSTVWVNADTAVIVGGQSATLSIANLSPDEYFVRNISTGIGVAAHVVDTTLPMVVTIVSGTPVIDSIRPTKIYYGKSLSYYGKNLGSIQGNGKLFLGDYNLSDSVSLWSATQIDVSTDSATVRGWYHSMLVTDGGDTLVPIDSVRVFRPYTR